MGKKKKDLFYPGLDDPKSKAMYRDKKGKGKKKSKHEQTDEEAEEIIEMLGGKEKIREYGRSLNAYTKRIQAMIILEDLSPDDYDECLKKLKKITKDMKEGKTYMFDYEGVAAYHDKLLSIRNRRRS